MEIGESELKLEALRRSFCCGIYKMRSAKRAINNVYRNEENSPNNFRNYPDKCY